MPMITSQLRQESSNVILPAEDGKLRPHLRRRRKGGIRMNINQLGEAILGESEAHHRLQQVVDRLTDKDCDYISVKISAIFSQIHLVAFEETVKLIQERLRILYRAAITNAVTLPDGSRKPKFVNLDMEEYRDLHLTAEAFKRTLMEDEFMQLEAGIVLQAYLPDSWEEQMKLCAWAKERVEQGGAHQNTPGERRQSGDGEGGGLHAWLGAGPVWHESPGGCQLQENAPLRLHAG